MGRLVGAHVAQEGPGIPHGSGMGSATGNSYNESLHRTRARPDDVRTTTGRRPHFVRTRQFAKVGEPSGGLDTYARLCVLHTLDLSIHT